MIVLGKGIWLTRLGRVVHFATKIAHGAFELRGGLASTLMVNLHAATHSLLANAPKRAADVSQQVRAVHRY